MSVEYSSEQKVREKFNRNPPQASTAQNTHALAVVGGGRLEGVVLPCAFQTTPGVSGSEETQRREGSGLQTKLFKAGGNGGENECSFRRGRLEVSWGEGKTQG